MQHLTRFSLIASLLASSALPAAAVTTIFAPGVSMTSGWYDTNKAFNNEDYNLCWAATATNIIAWWLDRYEAGGGDLTGISRDTATIFKNFQDNWANEGGDNSKGVNWYFTGGFSDNTNPSNLTNANSGGYLAYLDGVGGKNSWRTLNGDFTSFGNEETQVPFMNPMNGDYISNKHYEFSQIVINQLKLGATMMSVHKINALYGNSGHSITLWGCEYDEALGLVTKIYVTDSDDEARSGYGLKGYDIVVGSDGGIVMDNYWYGSDQYGRITDLTMMYSPYIPEPSAFGLLAGALALGLVVSRRRR